MYIERSPLQLRFLPSIPANIDHLFILFLIFRSERKRKTDCVKFYKLWISGGIYFFYIVCVPCTRFFFCMTILSWKTCHRTQSTQRVHLSKLNRAHSRVGFPRIDALHNRLQSVHLNISWSRAT